MTDGAVLWNSDETARHLGVDRRTLQAWRTRGVGPAFIRISNRCVRYRSDDVLAWLEGRVVGRDPIATSPLGERIVRLVTGPTLRRQP